MDHDPDAICLRLAREQFGLISQHQARAAGLSERSIERRVAKESWERELPGVLVIAGAPGSWERNVLAAVFWLGRESVASHRTAGRVWQLSGFEDDRVEVSTSKHASARRRLPDGTPIIVHHVDWRLLPRIVVERRIPVTTVPRTLADLAAIRHHRLERALDEALRRRLTTVPEIWLLIEAHWMKGRRGVKLLRDLLVPRTQGLAPTDSDLQVILTKIVRRANLPIPVREHPVALSWGVAHLDAAYPELRVGIELDGYAWHFDRRSFERDRQRDNELRAHGWTVLRFTWAMLKFEPDRVAELLTAVTTKKPTEIVGFLGVS